MTSKTRWAWAGAAATACVVLGLGGRALLQPPAPQAPPSAQAAASQGLPWQVEVLADGTSRVMGLHLGADTLARVRLRTGDGLQVALVARLGEVGVLEALAEPYTAGFVAGRLVLAFDVPPATLQRWRDGSTGSQPMEGGVRRFTLRAADQAEAEQSLLAGLSFIPVARLSEADVRQRFGAPQTQRTLEGGAVLLGYAERGLNATVIPGQRAAFQYVAPRDAARLGSGPGAP
jgi:hypothetical protein